MLKKNNMHRQRCFTGTLLAFLSDPADASGLDFWFLCLLKPAEHLSAHGSHSATVVNCSGDLTNSCLNSLSLFMQFLSKGILEWVAILYSPGSFLDSGSNPQTSGHSHLSVQGSLSLFL